MKVPHSNPRPLWITYAYARRCAAVGVLLVFAACETRSDRIVATAEGHELTVPQVVELLARQNTVPNEPAVVETLANFWVDYMLLAVSAQEDSLFSGLDLHPLLAPQFQQEIIDGYLASVVEADTALTEAELRVIWDADPPEDSVRARHILLTFPDQPTQVQVDSVVDLAVDLKNRATSGESFEELARRYSEDTGSGAAGGDLGYFGPGTMVQPLEEASYALEVGQVSDPVQTQFGLHLIQLVDRKPTSFESGAAAFRNSIVAQRTRRADSTYLAALDEEAELEVAPEAVTVLRELASDPGRSLSGRAGRRALVRYRGGAYRASELLEFLQTRPAEFTAQVLSASDGDLEDLLHRLGQSKVLVARAGEVGMTLPQERRDSLQMLTRARVTQAADALGLRRIRLRENETMADALDRTVLQILRELVAGTRNAIPVGVVTVALRRDEDWSVSDRAIAATVARIDELRGEAGRDRPQGAPTPAVPGGAARDSTRN